MRPLRGGGIGLILTIGLLASFKSAGMDDRSVSNAPANVALSVAASNEPQKSVTWPPFPPIEHAPPKPAAPVLPEPGRDWVNSLGQHFVPVPGTTVLFATTDTRVQDYRIFVDATHRQWKPSFFPQTANDPAVNVSWDDATAFCAWLSEKERAEGRLSSYQLYRLPTDAEWSAAVGLGPESGETPADKDGRIEGIFPWGRDWPPPLNAGNLGRALDVDDFDFTSPVGSFKPNRYGLFDMAGNVRQWCRDSYMGNENIRVLRGSSWTTVFVESLLSSTRVDAPRNQVSEFNGFRCLLAP